MITYKGKEYTRYNYNDFLKLFETSDGALDYGKAAAEWSKLEEAQGEQDELSKLNPKIKSPIDLPIFTIADELSDEVWNVVSRWKWFAKKTVGDQWVRSSDSIAANITEGYGRYFFKENILFLYYARGSAYEAKFWCDKAYKRGLLINNYLSISDKEMYDRLNLKFERLPIEINKVVKIIKSQDQKWKGMQK